MDLELVVMIGFPNQLKLRISNLTRECRRFIREVWCDEIMRGDQFIECPYHKCLVRQMPDLPKVADLLRGFPVMPISHNTFQVFYDSIEILDGKKTDLDRKVACLEARQLIPSHIELNDFSVPPYDLVFKLAEYKELIDLEANGSLVFCPFLDRKIKGNLVLIGDHVSLKLTLQTNEPPFVVTRGKYPIRCDKSQTTKSARRSSQHKIGQIATSPNLFGMPECSTENLLRRIYDQVELEYRQEQVDHIMKAISEPDRGINLNNRLYIDGARRSGKVTLALLIARLLLEQRKVTRVIIVQTGVNHMRKINSQVGLICPESTIVSSSCKLFVGPETLVIHYQPSLDPKPSTFGYLDNGCKAIIVSSTGLLEPTYTLRLLNFLGLTKSKIPLKNTPEFSPESVRRTFSDLYQKGVFIGIENGRLGSLLLKNINPIISPKCPIRKELMSERMWREIKMNWEAETLKYHDEPLTVYKAFYFREAEYPEAIHHDEFHLGSPYSTLMRYVKIQSLCTKDHPQIHLKIATKNDQKAKMKAIEQATHLNECFELQGNLEQVFEYPGMIVRAIRLCALADCDGARK